MYTNILKQSFIVPFLALAGAVAFSSQLSAKDELGEDPFALNQAQHQAGEGKDNWSGRSPEELRAWAKKNLHHKLTARRVIVAKDHPEWDWFRKSGLGLFLHWGLTSENPQTGDAWAMVWSERKAKSNRFMQTPEEMFAVAETWNPTKYDPDQWFAAASKAGFGYSVLTTRHHDGYALWPSDYGTWDTGDYMGGRDLVKDYVEASRKNNMRVGFYFSGPNWHYDYKNREFQNPPGKDYKVNYKHEKVSPDTKLTPLMATSSAAEKAESIGQVRELMTHYGQIDVVWWDGSVAMNEAELAEMQPGVFVARGNIATPEGEHQAASHNLKVSNEAGWWWESCQKSENSFTPNWHYGIECETNHWDANTLLTELIRCRALGGNLLVNVPPRGDGSMMDWFYEVCNEMEGWMAHSKEATYDVDQDAPLPMLDQTQNYTTKRGNTYYSLPDVESVIFITDVTRPKSVTLLRTGAKLDFEYRDSALRVVLPTEMETDLPDMVKIVF
ncbi:MULTISPECIES: alpha-L-fucosidase [unclassified Lentimonas]|uniref:alpha-L-fucosidase n=1 Tax=unclassified Lentimonas TaxID=2630993 RepID=UPI001329DA59|nr:MULTISPECIES: alpha-L-fucosidase [unclassified Lentimonas]CAA6676323.1 Alpha-L-fucosidase (EC [Lentimonas sp. CC4]CAA6683787.1 Alpha-L-fucosidase (EC [Lentimonas sp. CC6]CAA7077818.1 Alpha-L-fucosidase (EC [Lentimonas sp. CC4]CAA7169748.1 Alpha-L-fucosidase (EC [Lentimonas sp. CC21]CAA7179866.1 Alpha-L-fucosidase (EC [Lentimonas sp. CC8]